MPDLKKKSKKHKQNSIKLFCFYDNKTNHKSNTDSGINVS